MGQMGILFLQSQLLAEICGEYVTEKISVK
jgi:hypothetical protein